MSDFAFEAAGHAGVPPATAAPAAAVSVDPVATDPPPAEPPATRPTTPRTHPRPVDGADSSHDGLTAPGRDSAPRDDILAVPPLGRTTALALSAVSGLALWTAFPSLGWWPAAPLALAGLAVASRGRRARSAALVGLVFGLAFFVPHLHWSGVYVGLLPWTALSLFESLYVAVMAALFPLAWRAPGGRAGTVATISGLWVAQEALRGRQPFGGFPWARVAFSQSDAPTLGYAALGGAPLVTAAVAAIGSCLAIAAVSAVGSWQQSQQSPQSQQSQQPSPGAAAVGRAALRRAAPALAVGVAVLLGGLAVPRPVAAVRSAEVAAVQGNVPEAGLEFNAERRAVLDNHANATRQLAADVAAGRTPQPEVVLWPENSSDIDPLRNPDAAAVITQATDAVKVPVLIGAVLAGPAPNVSNAAILWGPTGTTAAGPGQRYVKRHPAPFAEYIPYRSFFRVFSDKVDLVRADFAAGDSVGVLAAGPARLGTVICFEVAYDSLVRDPVLGGADLLVVQTNNATFGYTDESVQQLAMSRLRAVETGRSVVHISTVGVSALITPDGREVARSDHFTQQVLQARLPLRTERTVATRLGAAPEAALAGIGLVLAGFAGFTGRGVGRTTPGAGEGGARRRRAGANIGEESRDAVRDGEQEQRP